MLFLLLINLIDIDIDIDSQFSVCFVGFFLSFLFSNGTDTWFKNSWYKPWDYILLNFLKVQKLKQNEQLEI